MSQAFPPVAFNLAELRWLAYRLPTEHSRTYTRNMLISEIRSEAGPYRGDVNLFCILGKVASVTTQGWRDVRGYCEDIRQRDKMKLRV